MKERMNENTVDENNIPSISYDRIFFNGRLTAESQKEVLFRLHITKTISFIYFILYTFTRNGYVMSINAYT